MIAGQLGALSARLGGLSGPQADNTTPFDPGKVSKYVVASFKSDSKAMNKASEQVIEDLEKLTDGDFSANNILTSYEGVKPQDSSMSASTKSLIVLCSLLSEWQAKHGTNNIFPNYGDIGKTITALKKVYLYFGASQVSKSIGTSPLTLPLMSMLPKAKPKGGRGGGRNITSSKSSGGFKPSTSMSLGPSMPMFGLSGPSITDMLASNKVRIAGAVAAAALLGYVIYRRNK